MEESNTDEKKRKSQNKLNQSSISSHQKSGSLMKLAGYLFKTQEKRHFVLFRNKLAYFIHKGDQKPKKIICLDGCSVEILSDSPPYSFQIVERAVIPSHTYTLFSNNRKDFNSWVEMLQRAALYYLEILYAGLAKDGSILVEHVFAHWQSEKEVFQKMTQEVLEHQRYRLSFTDSFGEDKKGVFTKAGFRVVFLNTSGIIFFCVVDERISNPRPEAFLEDIRERYKLIKESEEGLKEFGWLIKELMEVYSPGYEYKDPEKVKIRDAWLKRMGDSVNPEQLMDQLVEKAKGN